MTIARIAEVLVVGTTEGLGQDESDPVRRVFHLFTADGEPITTFDPWRFPGAASLAGLLERLAKEGR